MGRQTSCESSVRDTADSATPQESVKVRTVPSHVAESTVFCRLKFEFVLVWLLFVEVRGTAVGGPGQDDG